MTGRAERADNSRFATTGWMTGRGQPQLNYARSLPGAVQNIGGLW